MHTNKQVTVGLAGEQTIIHCMVGTHEDVTSKELASLTSIAQALASLTQDQLDDIGIEAHDCPPVFGVTGDLGLTVTVTLRGCATMFRAAKCLLEHEPLSRWEIATLMVENRNLSKQVQALEAAIASR